MPVQDVAGMGVNCPSLAGTFSIFYYLLSLLAKHAMGGLELDLSDRMTEIRLAPLLTSVIKQTSAPRCLLATIGICQPKVKYGVCRPSAKKAGMPIIDFLSNLEGDRNESEYLTNNPLHEAAVKLGWQYIQNMPTRSMEKSAHKEHLSLIDRTQQKQTSR